MNQYISRSLEPILLKAAAEFPAVVLVGPRQSGKTTLLKTLFKKEYKIISLEPPDVRIAAMNDPRGFLALYPPPVILDEIQYVPDLLLYIKEAIDSRRSLAGQYILTGSQNLLLMNQVTESLAGRAAVLKLLPFSRHELYGQPYRPLAWEGSGGEPISTSTLWAEMLRGYYPEIAINPDRDARLWQSSYVQTYLERDVRNLLKVGDLALFQTFLRLLAARCSQLLNLSDLARDTGVSVNTAKAWLSVLEASFQVLILRPFHTNFGKRLIKSPKVYFLDTGLLCYLVGLRDTEHASQGPMGGAIFENLVVTEIYKQYLGQGMEAPIFFWRTSDGHEVDLVVESENGVIPIEIKLSSTPHPAMARGIRVFQNNLTAPGTNAETISSAGFVIYPGEMRLPMGNGITAFPMAEL